MKKFAFLAVAALAMTFAACGNQNGANTKKGAKDEKAPKEVTYMTYTNDKYGFTVEVPEGMTRRGEAMGDEGTVFSLEDDSHGITFNRIDISGNENHYGEDYDIKKEAEDLMEFFDYSDRINVEIGDNYFTSTAPSESITQIDYIVVNGPKMVSIAICYEPEFEKQLGGEVAQHVFKSVKFK